MKKIILLLFIASTSFAQVNVVAGGTSDYTVGEVFPIMQQVQEEKEVFLSVPKFESPAKSPEPKVTKKSLFQKILDFIKTLINKNK